MIIIDTNVLSSPLSVKPEARVMAWFDRQNIVETYITAITVAELIVGAERMPSGRRRQNLMLAIEQVVKKLFLNRIFPFDTQAAQVYGVLAASLWSKGENFKMADLQIAAIAKLHGASVATRDVKPFLASGLHVINPWADE